MTTATDEDRAALQWLRGKTMTAETADDILLEWRAHARLEGQRAMQEKAAKVAEESHTAPGLRWTPFAIAIAIRNLTPGDSQ